MTEYIAIEKATPFRQPAVANLMVDSADGPPFRDASGVALGYRRNPWNFVISQSASLLNGYFTRLATTEVVLEWNIPNISEVNGNNSLTFTVESGGTYTVTLLDGFYTTYQLIQAFINQANDIQSEVVFAIDTGVNITGPPGFYVSSSTGSPNVSFTDNNLLGQLGIVPNDPVAAWILTNVDLRQYRYLDFVSANLTACQDVKDSTTNNFKRDVLCRWYMAYDDAPSTDVGGWPILMGYQSFQLRRLFNPAKQIRWEPNIPVGQLDFQVFGIGYGAPNGGQLVVSPAYDTRSNWLMTLQVSEN
jgi:hypothetical protein